MIDQFGKWFPSNPLTAPFLAATIPLVAAVTAVVFAYDTAEKTVSAIRYQGDLKRYKFEVGEAERQVSKAAVEIEQLQAESATFSRDAATLISQAVDCNISARPYGDLTHSEVNILQMLVALCRQSTTTPK
jgi:hypothetical protein